MKGMLELSVVILLIGNNNIERERVYVVTLTRGGLGGRSDPPGISYRNFTITSNMINKP